MTQKATVAPVQIGHLEIEGLMFEDGTFGIAIPQLVALNLVQPNLSLKRIEERVGIDFKTGGKAKTVFGKNLTNYIGLTDFEVLLAKLDRSGNKPAQDLRDALVGLSFHQLFCHAFYVKFDKDDWQEKLKQRNIGKQVRRTLTDAIQDWLELYEDTLPFYLRKHIYALATDAINKGIFARTARELCTDWECKNPRDSMTARELHLVTQVEDLTTRLLDSQGTNYTPLEAVAEALNRLIVPVQTR